jgi:hypothetical protein
MFSRRVLLVVSAVAAVLLGLEKVGVFRFVPPGDVGFRALPEVLPDGRQALVLHSDVGDLTCWIRLVVGSDTAASGPWEASISSGETLVVAAQAMGAAQQLSISKPPDPQRQEPFVWRTGSQIRVVRNGPSSDPIRLDDWAVYATTQPSDTASKALLRTWWTRGSWVMLILALVGAGLAAWPKAETPQIAGSVALVRSIVSTVDGTDAADTDQARAFLRKVLLEGVPVREALDALRLPTTPYRIRPQFVARARRIFLDRIFTVKQDLDALGDRLDGHF